MKNSFLDDEFTQSLLFALIIEATVFFLLATILLLRILYPTPAAAEEPAPPVIEQTTEDKLDGEDRPAEGFACLDRGEALGEFRLTAYCPCAKCCGKDDGITSTGTTATEGRTIAVDPRVIPYGSSVTIYYEDGTVHTYTAEDCGGGIKGNRLDIYFDDHQAAREFGVQTAYIYKEENNG